MLYLGKYKNNLPNKNSSDNEIRQYIINQNVKKLWILEKN